MPTKKLSKEEILAALVVEYSDDLEFMAKINRLSFGFIREDNLLNKIEDGEKT